jgi:hypothetical protein
MSDTLKQHMRPDETPKEFATRAAFAAKVAGGPTCGSYGSPNGRVGVMLFNADGMGLCAEFSVDQAESICADLRNAIDNAREGSVSD